MANEYFKGTDLRSYFHSFGRAFTAKGQNFLDQAPLKSGHTVATADVRAEAVPYIDAEFKLQADFMGVTSGTSILTGEIGSRTVIPELSGILKFYDGAPLTVMEATNGETYQLIDGVVIKGFIDPTDVFDSTGKKTADGYTIKVLTGSWTTGLTTNGTPIPMSKGWVVDPVNGAVTFENGKLPTTAIKIQAFAYVGKYTDAVLSTQASRLSAVESQLGIGGTAGGSVVEQIEFLSSAISGQVSARTTADTTLSTAIDNISAYVSGIPSSIDNVINPKLEALSGAISGEIETRTAADEFLSGAIDDISGILSSTSITGVSAIAVNTVNNASTVSLTIDTNDKVLTQSNAGLLTNISLVKLGTTEAGYAATYELQGIGGERLGDKINIPKDQFLKDVIFIPAATAADVTASADEVQLGKPCIKFTFDIKKKDANGIETSADQIVYVNVNGLVDIYTAGNGIDITSNVVSVKKDNASESFLSVTSAGVAITGVSAAIADAVDVVTGFVIDKAYATVEYVDTQDQKLSGAIDDISAYVSGIPGNIDNVINPKLEALSSAIDFVSGAVDTVSAALDAEVSARIAGDEFLSGAIDTVSAALDAEVSARIAGDEFLSGVLSGYDTVGAVKAADDALAAEISARFQTLNNQLSGLNNAMATLLGNIEALRD